MLGSLAKNGLQVLAHTQGVPLKTRAVEKLEFPGEIPDAGASLEGPCAGVPAFLCS